MSRKFILLPVMAIALIFTSGCRTSLDGRNHAAVPFIKDSVQARYERPPLEIWKAAQDVLSYNGTLYSMDQLKSTLEASVNSTTVWVQVIPLDSRVTEVTIQTKTKAGGADRALAAELDKQIAIRLASGNLTPASRTSAN